MKIHLTRSEVLGMLLKEMPNLTNTIEEVVITDGCDSVVPNDAIDFNTINDSFGKHDLVDVEKPKEFVNASFIVDSLERQLKLQGCSDRIPKDSKAVCIKAWESIIDKLSSDERSTVSKFVSESGWKVLVEIFDKYHSEIKKAL